MRAPVASSRTKIVLHFAVLALVSAGVAGCADSGRFGEPSFSMSGGAPEMTSAIPPAQPAPVARVESRPLGGTQLSSAPGGYGQSGYGQSGYAPPPQPAYNPPPRYNSPPAYQPVARVSAAQPTRTEAARTEAPRVAAKPIEKPAAKPKQVAAAPKQHDLAPKTLGTLPASAVDTKVAAAPRPAPAAAAKPTRVASLGPVATARVATAGDDPAADVKAGQPTNVAGASPSFRWPVRGRVIAGFGPKTSGQHNDGINLAVPEGTSVKAAEDGVVAYAGNELKGYGNLVLVRHSNGYVTAYAHASALKVKRGDTVKRGQIIALAGQTGSVESPQLHFEIRKGSSPVDPMPYLN